MSRAQCSRMNKSAANESGGRESLFSKVHARQHKVAGPWCNERFEGQEVKGKCLSDVYMGAGESTSSAILGCDRLATGHRLLCCNCLGFRGTAGFGGLAAPAHPPQHTLPRAHWMAGAWRGVSSPGRRQPRDSWASHLWGGARQAEWACMAVRPDEGKVRASEHKRSTVPTAVPTIFSRRAHHCAHPGEMACSRGNWPGSPSCCQARCGESPGWWPAGLSSHSTPEEKPRQEGEGKSTPPSPAVHSATQVCV